MPRKQIPTSGVADVIDLASRRRCHAERAGADPIAVAVHMFTETGEVPGWDFTTDPDDGSGWVA